MAEKPSAPVPRRRGRRGGIRSVLLLVLVLLVLTFGGILLAAVLGVPQARQFVGAFIALGPSDDPLAMLPPGSSVVLSVDVERLRQLPAFQESGAAASDLPVLEDTGLLPAEIDRVVVAADLALLIESEGEEAAYLAVLELARELPPAERIEQLRRGADGEALDDEVDGLPALTLLDDSGAPSLTVVPISERFLLAGQGSWLAAGVAAARGRLPGGLSDEMREACEPDARDELVWTCLTPSALPADADEQIESAELGPLAPPFSADDVRGARLTGEYDDLAGLELVLRLVLLDESTAAGAARWFQGVLPMAGLALGPAASGLGAEQDGEAVRVRLALSPEQVDELSGSAAEMAASSGLLDPGAVAAPPPPPPRRPRGRTVPTVTVLRDGVAYDAPEGEPIMRVRAGEEYPMLDDTLDNWYRLGNTPADIEAWLPGKDVELGELVITDGIGSPSDLK